MFADCDSSLSGLRPSFSQNFRGTSLTTQHPLRLERVANALDTNFSSANPSSSSVDESALLPVLPAPAPATALPVRSRVDVDFNGDGKTDLLWRNGATGQNAVWYMNGTTLASSTYLTPVNDSNWRMQGASDFTGDGKTDIVWRNYATGQNVIWEMDGITLRSSLLLLPTVADLNWQIQGTADFTGDGKTDLLWRNYATGENAVWALNGATLSTSTFLPTVVGGNLRMQAAADFNQDGQSDILWRNYLSGENFVWTMKGTTIASTTFLPTLSDLNWQIQGAEDLNGDGKTDLLWRHATSGENFTWLLNNLTYDVSQIPSLVSVRDANWRTGLQDTLLTSSLVKISDRSFSGQEGDAGTFKIQLTQAPTANVTLTLATGTFVVVDGDGSVANGSQNTITFTPQDWQTARTVSFLAEADNSSADRVLGNTVSYTLSGGFTGSATYELGKVTNTYAPNPNRFNLDLDFRNDSSGFWTPQNRAIAQKAADDWATKIANEWTDFQLDSTIGKLESFGARTYSFTSKRYVDDLLVFVNPYQSSGSAEPAIGGPDYQFGGWISSPELMPRVGQIAINPASFSAANDPSGWLLYQVVTHELGHVLGLVGLNWTGYNLQDRTTPQTAVFKGEYAKTANGGNNVALQSQDGANPVTGSYDYSHPADNVQSIMSYGWLYRLYAPSQVDYALLADSGYRVYGLNA
ncbi:MAG: FG-GAP-like repeat-containing protein [Stenomitos frigidus ULC029]